MGLCAQVERRENVLDDIYSLLPTTSDEAKCQSNFKSLPSFRAVVTIIDKEGWMNEGVLLVGTLDGELFKQWPIEIDEIDGQSR